MNVRKMSIKKIILYIIIGVLILTALLALYVFSPIVVIPTKSSSEKLTLTRLGAVTPKNISIKQYIGDKYICTYVLEIEHGLYNQTTQHYELPQIKEGTIDVEVEIDGYPQDNFVLVNRYSNAYEVYKNGLLIYFSTEYFDDSEQDKPSSKDRICFISGDDKYLYYRESHTSVWIHNNEIPPLKKYQKKDKIAYVPPWSYEWKTNKWIKKTQ